MKLNFLCLFILLLPAFTLVHADGHDSLSAQIIPPPTYSEIESQNGHNPSVKWPGDETTVFRPTQLILPSALIGVGIYGGYNGWARSLRSDVRDEVSRLRDGYYIHADDYIQYVPAMTNVIMGSLGIKAKHPLRERVVVTATSWIALGILVNAGKYSFREPRPDGSANNSFPSGHTATAFMGAELVRKEYGGAYAWAAYSVATAIGLLRVYNERHWLNDIIAGAGVGTLSAHIGYWLLPLNRRIFGWKDSSNPSVFVMPVIDPTGNGGGLALTVEL